MKTISAILVAVAATLALTSLTSCEDKPKNQVLDPLAKISIRADVDKASAAPTRAEYATPLEVVQKTTDIVLVSPLYPNEPWVNAGISDEQKDLITPKIMMWGMWVIENGQISRDFVEAKDVIFVTRQNQDRTKPISDTLAYIPNAKLRTAEVAIKEAFAAENYDLVYQLFDEAYKFTPINGADWLELKRQGKN